MVPRASTATDGWMLMSFPSGSKKGKATNESYQHWSPVLTGTFDHQAIKPREDYTSSQSTSKTMLFFFKVNLRPVSTCLRIFSENKILPSAL